MRLIGTAIAAAAALTLVTAGVANAHHHHGAKTYKFSVECPVLSPVAATKGTCSATGMTMDAARATCQMQNQFCYIRHAGKKHK